MAVQELTVARERESAAGGHLRRALRRLIRKKIAVACIATLVIVYSGGVFANWVAPQGYADQDLFAVRQGPSWDHIAGTDFAGRDVFTRVLWGIQNTVIITVIVMATGGLLIGITLGLVS